MIDESARQMGRAKNAMLTFFEQRLSVPRIYFDASWDTRLVDVLAIDRDGVGDVHVALLFADGYLDRLPDLAKRRQDIDEGIQRFAAISAQFKYVVFVAPVSGAKKDFEVSLDLRERSFSPDGLGRIGFVYVDFSAEDEPVAKMLVKPERFRAKVAELADEFVEKHSADWEIRA